MALMVGANPFILRVTKGVKSTMQNVFVETIIVEVTEEELATFGAIARAVPTNEVLVVTI